MISQKIFKLTTFRLRLGRLDFGGNVINSFSYTISPSVKLRIDLLTCRFGLRFLDALICSLLKNKIDFVKEKHPN